MNEVLKKKQRIRFDFLNKLYEMTDGSTEKLINGDDLANSLGLTEKDEGAMSAVNFLKDENLITDANIIAGPLGVLKITHSGVLEVENAISKPDMPTQHFLPINILHVHQMIGSTIQQGTIGSNQNAHIKIQNGQDIEQFIASLALSLNSLDLKQDDKAELEAEVETIKSQLGSPRPKAGIIHEGLKSIRTILESCVGSATGAQLSQQIPALINSLNG